MSLKAKLEKEFVQSYRIPMLTPKTVPEITGDHTTIYIQTELCKGCELCVTFCPQHILEMGEELNTKSYLFPHAIEGKRADCSQCRNCERVCPELAVFLAKD